MKLISWNVNGLRACVKKGFLEFFENIDADIFCVQEIKMQAGQLDLELNGYYQYYNYAKRKGYSGTAVFTKEKPISVTYGLLEEEHNDEGRVITLEFEKYYFVCCYTPNSKHELLRLDYRKIWEDAMRRHLCELDKKKPVVYCGDLNVAHKEIDLKNPNSNHNSPGFSDTERSKMTSLLESGFIDSFRYFYPDKTAAYSWWSYRFNARAKNVGWRIDYFIISNRLEQNLIDSKILSEIYGSDHCPIQLDININ